MKVKCYNPVCSVKFKPTARQKGALKKGHDIFCGTECRMIITATRNRQRYEKKELTPKECKFCGKLFMPKNSNQQYCPPAPGKNGCQYEATLERNRGTYMATKTVNPSTTGRKCKICGQDPYPNFYFCRGCHSKVGDNDIQNEHSIGAWA